MYCVHFVVSDSVLLGRYVLTTESLGTGTEK